MRYSFPLIENIYDVLPAIEGRDEFIVVQKDGYQVVNYAVMMEDSFPPVTGDDFCPGCKEYKTERGDCGSQRCPDFVSAAAIRRECRGLVFDLEGKLINRRYHKFFNVNERDETAIHAIDWSRPHVILEKLDGSMVSPCYVNGHIRWMTKMGITDTSMEAEAFVASRPDYAELAAHYLDHGFTPVFEWCSNKNRIVLDYPEDRLVLTAMRENASGNYLLQDALEAIGARYGIEVVEAYQHGDDEIVDQVRKWQDTEGVVVRFDDGHMVKIKAEWYVLRHKSKDAITREKNVLDYVVNERVDDVLPFLQAEDRSRLLRFQDHFRAGVSASTAYYDAYIMTIADVDRKTWAVEHMPALKAREPHLSHIVFGWYTGRDTRESIMDIIRKNIGSQSRIDAVRDLWGHARWHYSFDGDA